MRTRRIVAIALAAALGLAARTPRADAQPGRSAYGSAGPPGAAGDADPAPAEPPDRPDRGDRRDRKAERREQIKKKIRAMRAYTLTEELALDEQTAGRLFPVLARYDDEIDKLLERRVDLQRRLRRADATRDPRAVDRTIDEAVANQRGFAALEDRRIADLRKILTPVQTAKLLITLPALERRIETQLRKAIVDRVGRANDDDRQPDEPDPRLPAPRAPRRREAPLAPSATRSNASGNTPPCQPNTDGCR